MTHTVPERGRITDALVAFLKSTAEITDFPMLVGDGDPPDAAGWAGTPGQSPFVASVTARTGVAVPQQQREGVRNRHTSWQMRYGLRTIAELRQRADAGADIVRAKMVGWRPEPIAGWTVQDIVYTQLGGVDPKGTEGRDRVFEVDDVVDVWVTRAVT